ncbi:MAG: glycoside hydrolase family 97 C-terminal domain-containing protein [Akkermansia sp.]
MEAAFPKDSPEREVVRNIPSVWEETIVLPPSAIGECAAFARRSGNQWYIALMNGDGRERTVSIPLNFLDKNTAYQASILRDLAEKNDGWSVETRKVTSGNTLSFTMRVKGAALPAWSPPESSVPFRLLNGSSSGKGRGYFPLLPFHLKRPFRKGRIPIIYYLRQSPTSLPAERPEKTAKGSVLASLLHGAPRREPLHVPEAVAAFQKSSVQAGKMGRAIKMPILRTPLPRHWSNTSMHLEFRPSRITVSSKSFGAWAKMRISSFFSPALFPASKSTIMPNSFGWYAPGFSTREDSMDLSIRLAKFSPLLACACRNPASVMSAWIKWGAE